MNIYIEEGRWGKTFRHIKQSYQYFKTENELNYHLLAPKGVSMLSVLVWFFGKNIRNVELVLNYRSLKPRVLKWVQRKNVRFSVLLVVDRKLKEREWKRICNLDGIIRIWDNTGENEETYYKKERRVLYQSAQTDGFKEADEFRLACGEHGIYQCNYTSCLGRNVYVAKDGTLSFCPKYTEKTKVGYISNPEQFFTSDVLAHALQQMIEKREDCKKECVYYGKCKGGCLFEKKCEEFKENQENCEQEIADILKNQTHLDTLHFAKEMSLLQMLCRVKNK